MFLDSLSGPFLRPEMCNFAVCVEFPIGSKLHFSQWKTYFSKFVDKFLKFVEMEYLIHYVTFNVGCCDGFRHASDEIITIN